ncbi:MAG: NAD(P)H:quinone oxidoreductase [Thioalkalivibrionaceae bacterium]
MTSHPDSSTEPVEPTRVVVLYYSRTGATERLARAIATGAERAHEPTAPIDVWVRRVPALNASQTPASESTGAPPITLDELAAADGLIVGSPTRFGNMAAPLKHFIDQTGALWASGALAGRPFGVFTSTGTLHGGQESTLLSMALPWLHHGMLMTGLPYTEPRLSHTHEGGTPYGASQVSEDGRADPTRLSRDEQTLAEHFGERIAKIAQRLKQTSEH